MYSIKSCPDSMCFVLNASFIDFIKLVVSFTLFLNAHLKYFLAHNKTFDHVNIIWIDDLMLYLIYHKPLSIYYLVATYYTIHYKHKGYNKLSIKYYWRQFHWKWNVTNIMNNLTVINVQSKYRFSMSAMSHLVRIMEQNGICGVIKFNWPKDGFLIFVTIANNPNYCFYCYLHFISLVQMITLPRITYCVHIA